VNGQTFLPEKVQMTEVARRSEHAVSLAAEREMISTRTIAALAAAKASGVKLGNPQLKPGDRRAARTANADAHTADVMPYIEAAGFRTAELSNRGRR